MRENRTLNHVNDTGNDEGAAGLEIAMGGLELKATRGVSMALTGADCSAMVTSGGGTREGRVSVGVGVNETFRMEAMGDYYHILTRNHRFYSLLPYNPYPEP